MSTQSALTFINAARSNDTLRAQLEALPHGATLEAVVNVAMAAGYCFDTAELRRALHTDYRMRLLKYNS